MIYMIDHICHFLMHEAILIIINSARSLNKLNKGNMITKLIIVI